MKTVIHSTTRTALRFLTGWGGALLALAVFALVALHSVHATTPSDLDVMGFSGLFLAGVLKTGTFDMSSLEAVRFSSVAQIGEDKIAAVLQADNENYNQMVQGALNDLCEMTSDRQRAAGSSISGDMLEADEYSRIPTQKDLPGYLIGFPLRAYQFAVGWTRKFLNKATANDLIIKQLAAQGANLRRIRQQIQLAIFTPTNSTFVDNLVDNASLSVMALINADSTAIQNGPNGESFDGTTHSHYNANATLTAAAVQATIDDIVEHGFGQDVRVYIALTNATAFSQLSGFVALQDPRVTLNANANQATDRLDITRMDNRLIGLFGAAKVYVKPWVPANYLLAFDAAAPQKPLVMRTEVANLGLHIEASISTFPLQADYFENIFGFGVLNRLAMAVLEFDNASYSAPTFTL